MRARFPILFAFALAVLFITPSLPTAAQETQRRIAGRSWRCDASISLTGSTAVYTPPTWSMKAGDPHTVWSDREKSCRKYVDAEILTRSIWSKLKLTPSEQDKICRTGSGKLRAEYSFDKRPKSWAFTKTLAAPPCDCQLRCRPGYDLDTGSSPGNPRCVRLLCQGAAAGIPDERFGPHENGLGIWHGNVYHHQPVRRGPCTFR